MTTTNEDTDAMGEKLRIAEELLAQKVAENTALVEAQKKLTQPIKEQVEKTLAAAPEVVKAKFVGREMDPLVALDEVNKELAEYEKIKAAAMEEVKTQVKDYQDTIAKKYGTRLPELDKVILEKKEQPVIVNTNVVNNNTSPTVGDLAAKPQVTYEEAKIITGRLSSMTAYLAAKKEAAVAAKK